MPSQGEAQQSGKSYLETAQDMASNAAKTVSDTVSGKLCLFSSFESSLLIKPQALLVTSRDQAPAPPSEQFLMIPQRPVFFCLSERTRAVPFPEGPRWSNEDDRCLAWWETKAVDGVC